MVFLPMDMKPKMEKNTKFVTETKIFTLNVNLKPNLLKPSKEILQSSKLARDCCVQFKNKEYLQKLNKQASLKTYVKDLSLQGNIRKQNLQFHFK